MTTAESKRFPRITRDPQVMGGKPCIRDTRVTVRTVVELMLADWTRAQILKAYPYIEEGDLQEAVAFIAHQLGEAPQ